VQKYKDTNNKVHDIEEGFEHLLPIGSVKITDAQTEALLKAPPETPVEARARKDAQVETELGSDTIRILIEALIPIITDDSIKSMSAIDVLNLVKSNRRAELE